MRLQKQIAAARDRATDLAKADTWTGWSRGARQPRRHRPGRRHRSTTAPRSRARAALIAFEFGDGLAEAKAAVDALGGQGGLDGEHRRGVRRARARTTRTPRSSRPMPRSRRAAGRRRAVRRRARRRCSPAIQGRGHVRSRPRSSKEPRPLYGVGARARVRGGVLVGRGARRRSITCSRSDADHPAAVIERGVVLAASGRIAPGSSRRHRHARAARAARRRGQPAARRAARTACRRRRSRTPSSVARARRLRARRCQRPRAPISARGRCRRSTTSASPRRRSRPCTRSATSRRRALADRALRQWPTSRRARIALAADPARASASAADALDALAKQAEVTALPLRARGARRRPARVGDDDDARADFEAALKKLPSLEPALSAARGSISQAGNARRREEARRAARTARQTPRRRRSPRCTPRSCAARRRGRARQGQGDARQGRRGAARRSTWRARSSSSRGSIAISATSAARARRTPRRVEGAATSKRGSRARCCRSTIAIRSAAARRSTALLQGDRRSPAGRLVLEAARARMLVGDHARRDAAARDRPRSCPTSRSGSSSASAAGSRCARGDFAGADPRARRARSTAAATTSRRSCSPPTPRPRDEKRRRRSPSKLKKLAPIGSRAVPEAPIVTGKLADRRRQVRRRARRVHAGARRAREGARVVAPDRAGRLRRRASRTTTCKNDAEAQDRARRS